MIRYLFYAATIIVWGIFIYAFHRDRSRYRNCLILFVALMMSAEGLLLLADSRGDDEKISEAEAMKRYMIEKGIPEDHILAEDRSATTFENIANSKKIIEARGGRHYTALVTSNYHVYRALRYCKKVGLQCTGIGSHVAFYYWPSALIREYIAVHAEKKHAVMLVVGWILALIAVMILLMLYYK